MNKQMLIEEYDKLPLKVKELIFEYIEKGDWDTLEILLSFLEYCESPIEKILYTALYLLVKDELYIDVQSKIKCNEQTYYADLCIEYDEHCNNILKENFKLAIECDGFNYHHKNKKQVDYDNKREYDLKKCGYDILRFSGSRIYKEPIQCAKEILEYIIAKGYKEDE